MGGGCLWEVVAYERWSHMEVRQYFHEIQAVKTEENVQTQL